MEDTPNYDKQTNIVAIKYQDKIDPKTFGGKPYTYYAEEDMKIGDIVEVPTRFGIQIGVITKINIQEKYIENIKPFMKNITRKISKEEFENGIKG